MPRILYWNVNNFTADRIRVAGHKRSRDDDYGAPSPGVIHRQVMRDTFRPGLMGFVQDLDFIVIVEILGTGGGVVEGQLVADNGRQGCRDLRQLIRQGVPGGNSWRLVPPIVTGAGGRREAVAVYFRDDRWYFLGPQALPQPGVAFPYPVDFRGQYLTNRPIPPAYPYMSPGGVALPAAQRREQRRAGQYRFPNAAPPVGGGAAPPNVQFPAAGFRSPWLTAFGARGAAGGPADLIRIAAFHATPNNMFLAANNWADQGTAALANCWDLMGRPADAPNQIDVIVGDFNVDNTNAANFAGVGPFAGLMANYTPLVQPGPGVAANQFSYYHTHGRPAGNWNTEIAQANFAPPPAANVLAVGDFPGRHYSDLSIDNAFVRYRGGALPPGGGHSMTILTGVRDLPYPPVAGVLTGTYQEPHMGATTPDQAIMHWNGLTRAQANLYDINEYFRSWHNYGKLYSTSDHFALLFDV